MQLFGSVECRDISRLKKQKKVRNGNEENEKSRRPAYSYSEHDLQEVFFNMKDKWSLWDVSVESKLDFFFYAHARTISSTNTYSKQTDLSTFSGAVL